MGCGIVVNCEPNRMNLDVYKKVHKFYNLCLSKKCPCSHFRHYTVTCDFVKKDFYPRMRQQVKESKLPLFQNISEEDIHFFILNLVIYAENKYPNPIEYIEQYIPNESTYSNEYNAWREYIIKNKL